MVRVLRYPYLTGLTCLCAVSCAVARDLCVGAGLLGWARVLLICTFVLLGLCFALLSCRFFVDELGVGVGFLLRVRRTAWHELASVGVLSCNSRRTYLYGLYTHSTGFLELLHRAPGCGSWGVVVPTSRRLVSAVLDLCPEEINFTPAPRKHPVNPLRPLWHQAAMYMLLLIPGGALAFFTGAMMLVRASEMASALSVVGLTLAACGSEKTDAGNDGKEEDSATVNGVVNRMGDFLVLLTDDGTYQVFDFGEDVDQGRLEEGDSVTVTYTGELGSEDPVPVAVSVEKTDAV